ncbi:hypothetical protein GO988_20695 [Hymenobacter sp. HMF4947]|uniref:Uncharacterized protein n=1 Tax=Hymenobacter ginkgonis TaxID=2682976 RepID=A0A7K1TK30_9BACT|nr:hypothetical protein [Hymenobacter ginkgonis]MVN78759.1 hypothetical protein [Hymenobacter ginkgonis]
MNNPFAKPGTVQEWLLSSTCWAASCLGCWWGGIYIFSQWAGEESVELLFLLFGFLAAHLLIWRYAVLRGWVLVGWKEAIAPLWLKILACSWLGILVLFQLTCSMLFLLLLAFLS